MAKSKRINKVIKFMIISSFLLCAAWGFLTPIFAIFILEKITAGSPAKAAEVAGFAFFVYWGVKSILQIPISLHLDKNHGEKDDYWFMVLGLFICALTPLGYLISSAAWHIYSFEVLHAVGLALFVPSWYAIFTRHIDKGREAFEWGMDSTFLGFGTAITGALGGLLAATVGFNVIFILTAVINIISSFILIFIHKDIMIQDHILVHRSKSAPF